MDVAFAPYFVNASQNEVNGRTSSYNIINGMAPESYSCCLRRKVIQWPFENGTHTQWRHTTQPVRITSQGWIQRSLDTEMKKPGGEQSKLCITRWLEVMDVIKKISWQIWGEFYEQNSVFNHALERQWKSLRQTRRDGEGNLSSRQCPAFALLPQPQKDSCQSLTLSIAIFHRVGMTWLPTQIISGDIACYDIPGFVPIRRGQELFGAVYDMNSFGPSPHLARQRQLPGFVERSYTLHSSE